MNWVLGILIWWSVGFALSSSGSNSSTFIGADHFFLGTTGFSPGNLAKFILTLSFAAVSIKIVSGAVAERFTLLAHALFTIMMIGFVYPVVAHWVWSRDGWLSPFCGVAFPGSWLPEGILGLLDYSGGVVVHVQGGIAALVAIVILGYRKGRFAANGKPVQLKSFEVPYQLDDVSLYNSAASTWTLATPRTTWEYVQRIPYVFSTDVCTY